MFKRKVKGFCMDNTQRQTMINRWTIEKKSFKNLTPLAKKVKLMMFDD